MTAASTSGNCDFYCELFLTINTVFTLNLSQLSVDHKVLKLGDFGLARTTEGTRQTKTQIGSYRYMAPEVVSSGGHYSKKADVHSFGESTTTNAVISTYLPDTLEPPTVTLYIIRRKLD